MKQYVLNILLGLDRLFNAMFGGDSKETMSTRVYRYRNDNFVAYFVYRLLNWLDPNHCEDAAKYDYSPDHTGDEVLK